MMKKYILTIFCIFLSNINASKPEKIPVREVKRLDINAEWKNAKVIPEEGNYNDYYSDGDDEDFDPLRLKINKTKKKLKPKKPKKIISLEEVKDLSCNYGDKENNQKIGRTPFSYEQRAALIAALRDWVANKTYEKQKLLDVGLTEKQMKSWFWHKERYLEGKVNEEKVREDRVERYLKEAWF